MNLPMTWRNLCAECNCTSSSLGRVRDTASPQSFPGTDWCPIKRTIRTLLVAQWLRIRLPMQGTRVQALVREDPTCRRATKPVRHNYWTCALELTSHNYWACVPQLLKLAPLESVLHTREATTMRSLSTAMKSSPRLLQLEKARVQQRRSNAAKNK